MEPGQRVDRYRLREPLAAPAGAERWLADDPELGRTVIIDLIGGDAEQRRRLLARARAVARVAHPALVTLYDTGELDERIFLISEQVADRAGPPRSWRAALARVLGAGQGLAAAHRAGIAHGALTEGHLLVDGDGRARLAGFVPGREGAEPATDQRAFAALARQQLDAAGGAPAALRRILARGAAAEWPSVAAMIDALEAVPRRRRAIALA
ncbi:MAG TPA: hypothetical protein VL172_01645, partial [Kofleriaceae bacterium]|nr:hypothetical protein [Kofleriaceae bacterium]